MLKKNKSQVIISSFVTLLPILFGLIMWNDLPNTVATHWGADGVSDGFGSKAFIVFGMPVMMLIVHIVCLVITAHDKKQKEQHPKALRIVFWIAPLISLSVSAILYPAAMGKAFDLFTVLPILLGIMYIFLGNYLPKIKPNSTLGIKVPWTLNNEDNWNRTHRLGGKIFVGCGVAMLIAAFTPEKIMVAVMVAVIAASGIIPMLYSYAIYKKDIKAAIDYSIPTRSTGQKAAAIIVTIVVIMLLIGLVPLLLTGDIYVSCGDNALSIDASYYSDLHVEYAEIDSVSYRSALDVGVRTNGFGSPRLSMGTFKNDEFGSYTLYSYTGANEYIVLTSGDDTLVIGLKTPVETQSLYETLSEKIS